MAPIFDSVTRSLGRLGIPTAVPPPPFVDEAFARLTRASADLPSVFAAAASTAKLHVYPCDAATLSAAICDRLRLAGHNTAVLTRCPLFDRIALLDAIRAAGITASYWNESTLDTVYDVDVGISDVWSAVAETGSIVVRGSAEHGRAVSLVPPFHIAVVERSQIVPDLIDLMRKIDAEGGTASGVVIITGPSKTADIEMNLVVGVHGPGAVDVFLV